MYGEDDQVVAGTVKVADAGFQVAAGMQVKLAGRFEDRPAGRFDDEQFAAQAAHLVLDPPEQFLADPLTLELLTGPDPVQVEGCFGQRTAAVGGKAADLLTGARHQEVVPALLAFRGEFRPEFLDGADVVGIEQGDRAR